MLVKLAKAIGVVRQEQAVLRGQFEALGTARAGKDGVSPDLHMVAAEAAKLIPVPQPPSIMEVAMAAARLVPEAERGRDAVAPSIRDVADLIARDMEKPKDGVSPDVKKVAAEAAKLIPAPKDPDINAIVAKAVKLIPESKRGERGKDGPRGKEGPRGERGKDGDRVTDLELKGNELFVSINGTRTLIGKIKIPTTMAPFRPGNEGGGSSGITVDTGASEILQDQTAGFKVTPSNMGKTQIMRISAPTIITIDDATAVGLKAGSKLKVNWESDTGSNRMIFRFSGLQNSSSAVGYEIESVGKSAELTYLGTDSWFLDGVLEANKNYEFTAVTTAPGETFTIPAIITGDYDCVVDWGDGSTSTITTYNDPEWTHIYAVAGNQEIKVSGVFTALKYTFFGDASKIFDVSNWGNNVWAEDQTGSYSFCSNLTITATDVPNFSKVTSLAVMFSNSALVNPDTTFWDVSKVTSFSSLFGNAVSANPDVSLWDMSSAIRISSMFSGALIANPDVSLWNVSNVAVFDGVFASTAIANPDVSLWNVSNGTSFISAFLGALAANPDVSNWDMSNATTIQDMFAGTAIANPDVSLWNVSNVTTFQGVFNNALSANPDVSLWNVTVANTLRAMFKGAIMANPNVSLWDVSNITNMVDMMENSAFNQTNYDLALVAWITLTLQNGVSFDAGNAQFGAGAPATAKADIVAIYSWGIQDGGPA